MNILQGMTNYKSDLYYFYRPLREVLLDQGRRQNWLASKLGFSPSTVSQWCCHGRGIPPEHAQRIADLLNIPLKQQP